MPEAPATNLLPPGDPDQSMFAGNGGQPPPAATPPPLGASPEGTTITHNGQQVTLSPQELIDLAQKGFDYTAKTQALASQRESVRIYEELDKALQANPQVTLENLARAYNVQLGQPTRESNGYDSDWDTAEEPDPRDERIARLEARLEQQDREKMRETVTDQLEAAAGILGDNFDRHALARFAHEQGLGTNLEAAAALIAHWEAQTSAAEGNAAAEAAKRNLPPTAGGSSAPAEGSVANGAPERQARTLREAFEMAEQDTGYQFQH